jgi:outer membrane protein assembly factor BamB
MARSRPYVFLGLLSFVALWPYPGSGQNGARNGEWRAYRAEEGSSAYSPLDQINRDTVKNLQVAWTWKFDNFGTAAQTATTETTPIMINGVLYFTAGQRRSVVAADAGTGETLWTWRLDEGARFDAAPRSMPPPARSTAALPTGVMVPTSASSW